VVSASARAMMSTRSIAAYIAFFLSGASSLIFQTIWSRMLHHVFGATSVAISTVLTVFMAGLGLGAWLGGKYANRIKHPIITYAVAEIGVGLWGLLVPLLVQSDGWLANVNMFLRAEFGAESGMFMVARFLCVFPLLLIPTTLMGSTLPLLTRHFVSASQGSQDAGARVGVLYALNTFGAATGPLLSAFFLMPEYGLAVTNIVACSMNFSLAALIFIARKPLLAGMWKPGEPLRFWPGTADEDGPSPADVTAEAPADPPAGDEDGEAFDELDPSTAKLGAYRDPAEHEGEEDDAVDDASERERSPREKRRLALERRALDEQHERTRLVIGVATLFFVLLLVGAGLSVGRGLYRLLILLATGVLGLTSAAYAQRLRRLESGEVDLDDDEPIEERERPVPELARKAAFLAFAASGAAALCYEVVWSRALAMTIGSSIYSFSLILETFLIGIATGSAAMSAFMGRKASPFIGLGITCAVLVLFANVPWAIDIVDPQDTDTRFHGNAWSYILLNLCFIAPIAIAVIWMGLKMRRRGGDADAFRDDIAIWKPILTVGVAAMPVIAAGINAGHFPGYFPQIILSVVASIAVFLALASLLARTPVLLVAIVQLFIAGATVVSYYWQDEIPYAFAQLVAGIDPAVLPDRVGTVQFYMFVTIVLCTLPSTLGMGAMFPLTVRLWTSGGGKIARDVAVVYTGNTVGSIIGSWLPGFILFALVGAEHTLHLGIALNMILALVLLIAGAADPSEDQTWWTWRRVAAIGLPALAAVVMGIDAWAGGVEHPQFALRLASAVGFVALAVAEHQWLKRCDAEEGKPPAALAGLLAGVPLVITVSLAFYLESPPATAEWALLAVVVALKGFLQHVGAVVAWANWREWTQATSPPPAAPTPSEAGAVAKKKKTRKKAAEPRDDSPKKTAAKTATDERAKAKRKKTSVGRSQPATDAKAKKKKAKKKRSADDLPLWHAATIYVLAPLIPALLALLYLGTKSPDSFLRWNRTQMTLGVFRVSLAQGMLGPDWGAPDLVYYSDGLTTTVSVERWGRHYALKNNGKVDASNGDDMPTQINVAAYPLLLHPNGPQDLDVAVIGFGSGVSVGTSLQFPVRRVDVIELERSIPEAARFFEDVNHLDYRLDHWPYVEMDRLTVINDDGRNYLASTQQMYDVIISEPSNPWITGVSDLFTVDHWRITQRRLRPGGIYCQWVQLYELSPENIKTIYRTFASQFEHVLVLSADDRSSDTVMLGSDQPIRLDLERVRPFFQTIECQEDDPAGYCHCERDSEDRVVNPTCPHPVAAELERANVYSPYDVFARTLLVSRDEVMEYSHIEYHRRGTEDVFFGLWEQPRWVPDPGSTNVGECSAPDCRRRPAILNTDDNARIEFNAPRDLIGFSRYEGYLASIYSEEWPYGHPREVLAGFGEGDVASRNYAELAMSMIAHGRYGWAGDFIEESQRVGRSRETAVALEVLTHLLTTDNEPAIRIEPPIPGPEMDRATARALTDGFDAVRDSVDEHAYGAALIAMEQIPAPLRLHSGPGLRFLYAYLLYKAADGSFSQYRAAIEHLEDMARTEPDYVLRHPEVYYFLARSHDARGDYAQALRAMRAYVEARLVPVNNDAAETPEPPDGEAPTTDAPGESDKDQHPDR